MKCRYPSYNEEAGMKPLSAREWKMCDKHRLYFKLYQRERTKKKLKNATSR